LKTPLLLTALVALFAAASPASAEIEEFRITRTNLDVEGYSFFVSTNRATDGVEFQVTVTAMISEISTNCGVALQIPTGDQNNVRAKIRRAPVALPSIAVQKKQRKMWKANFTVGSETADYPDLYFIFIVPAESRANGQTILMPGADIFKLRLQDFVSQSDLGPTNDFNGRSKRTGTRLQRSEAFSQPNSNNERAAP
jgi:hypothetical protein